MLISKREQLASCSLFTVFQDILIKRGVKVPTYQHLCRATGLELIFGHSQINAVVYTSTRHIGV